ncbi:MAG TPA: shikimate kinase [Candidatus Nitrosotenuis sp.]|jgi:shikimate kinase|nr:shikimate kinase [Candidatus Nitrosotenuis sp.]
MQVKATVNGAISIVNAISTWKGATLGISAKVEAIVSTSDGKGIHLELDNQNTSSRLVNKVVELAVPKKEIEKNKININLKSEIPTGYGLKSSSAISSVISLACHKLFKPNYTDTQVLNAGIDASLATKVSMTGALDDAAACYFGGIQVTDNKSRKIIRSDKAPSNIVAIIFVPKSRKRGNIKHLKTLESVFQRAWDFAMNGDYWNAMTLNGYATSAVLNSDPKIISKLIESGAISASVSGNGPSIAALVKKDNVSKIKKVFSEYDGVTMISQINNRRAEVYEM